MQPEQKTDISLRQSAANAADTADETVVVLPRCPNGHEVQAGATLCPACGTFVEGSVPAPPTKSLLPHVPGYELLQELGRGGMGVVYKARHVKLNRIVAIKMILAGEFATADARQRFQREAEAVARLQHPNVVQLYEIGEADGKAFFSLEFIDGAGLADRLRGTPLTPTQAAQLVLVLAQAVQGAHEQGIVHRDLKPGNILIAGSDTLPAEQWTPKIADFGLAKQLNEVTQHTQSGIVLGTPSYMAPEQASGQTDRIGPATDVYALGAILYELLTGRPPFLAPSAYDTIVQVLHAEPLSLRRLQPQVPRDLETIALTCLQKAPAKRYGSAQKLVEDLQRFLEGAPIHARPTRTVERAVKWARRRPAVAALWIGGMLALSGALIGYGIYEQRVHATRAETQAAALVKSLATAETSTVPHIVAQLEPLRVWADPLLRKVLADAPDDKSRLHASLALLPVDPQQVEYLRGQLLRAAPDVAPVLCQSLSDHGPSLAPAFWKKLLDPCADVEERLRSASALAYFAPDDARWEDRAPFVVNRLLVAVQRSPSHYAVFVKTFQPLRARLIPTLTVVFNDPDRSQSDRSFAANFLVDYAADQPPVLAELLMDADDNQFAIIYPVATKAEGRQAVARLLSAEIEKQAAPDDGDDGKEKLAKRQANAAVAMLKMDQAATLWPLLKHSPDPRLRSYLIHRIGPLGADARVIVKRLDNEPDLTIRRALILSLGAFPETALSAEERTQITAKLHNIYKEADPGLHAAAEWLLRTWKDEPWLQQVNEEWAKEEKREEKRLKAIRQTLALEKEKTPPQWYVNGQGQTMVVIPGPVKFEMGSPVSEKGRFETEAAHPMRIGRTFAIAAKPVTVAEFRRFKKSHTFTERYAPTPDCPVVSVSWYSAAAYCNWLSEHDGISADQWCYQMDMKGNVTRLKENYLSLSGYRLPTEAEMEYATRAGAVTSRYYGDSEELLPMYSWYVMNSADRAQPVGTRTPNDFGMFDMYGNVWNWCQEKLVKKNRPVEDIEDTLTIDSQELRVVRGGSFIVRPWNLRSANFDWHVPTLENIFVGFRVARTIAK